MCQRTFNSRSSLLIATDAASEGLNLHARCRLVIHFELPWTPMRLEQRAGRVDRLGQTRRVHEILLVGNDTAERLVLAPLLIRSMRVRSALPTDKVALEHVSESSVVTAVMQGLELEPTVAAASAEYHNPPIDVRTEAIFEAERVVECRRLQGIVGLQREPTLDRVFVTVLPRARHLACGTFAIYELALTGREGAYAHREYAVAFGLDEGPPPEMIARFRNADVPLSRELMRRYEARLTGIRSRAIAAVRTMVEREEAIVRTLPCAASQLVQAGLFDQREVRASVARSQAAAGSVDEMRRRVEALLEGAPVQASARLCGILIVRGEDRA
jgi:hypothetical protein